MEVKADEVMVTKRTGPQCPREEHDVTPAAEDGIEVDKAGRSAETVPAGQRSREGERTATRSAGARNDDDEETCANFLKIKTIRHVADHGEDRRRTKKK